LLAFSLDLTAETITFEFSEVVNVSSISINDMVLTNSFVSVDPRWDACRLTTASGLRVLYPSQIDVDHSHAVSPNGRVIVVELGTEDFNALTQKETLALSAGSTTLVFDASIINDMVGNPTVLWTEFVANNAKNYTKDTVPPTVREAFVFFNNETVILKFSETVNHLTFDASTVTIFDPRYPTDTETLQRYEGAGLNGASIQLSNSSVVLQTSNNAEIMIFVGREEMNRIKLMHSITNDDRYCFAEPNCRNLTLNFIVGKLDSNLNQVPAVLDMAGVAALSMTSQLAVSPIVADMVGPVLYGFGINLITNELILTYNEPMSTRAEDVDWAGIRFCDDPSCTGSTYVFKDVTSGNFSFVSDTYRTELVIKMPKSDLETMRTNLTFMTSQADTFLEVNYDNNPFLKDLSDNGNQGMNPAGHDCNFFRFYDETTFDFYYSHYNISELMSTATIKVTRDPVAFPGRVRVLVEAVNGTATAPSYFITEQTWIEFAAEQYEATFDVIITAQGRTQPGRRAGAIDDRDVTLNIVAVEPKYKVASHIGERSSVPLTIWAGCEITSDTCSFEWISNTGTSYKRLDLSVNPDLFRMEELAFP
jgi:hypothetical protein